MVFQIVLRGGGIPPGGEAMGNFAWGDFFIGLWEPDEEL